MSLPSDQQPAEVPVLDYAPGEKKPRHWRVFFVGAGIAVVMSFISVALESNEYFLLPNLLFVGPLIVLWAILGMSDDVFVAVMFGGSPILYGIYAVALVFSRRRWWYLAGIVALHVLSGAILWWVLPLR